MRRIGAISGGVPSRSTGLSAPWSRRLFGRRAGGCKQLPADGARAHQASEGPGLEYQMMTCANVCVQAVAVGFCPRRLVQCWRCLAFELLPPLLSVSWPAPAARPARPGEWTILPDSKYLPSDALGLFIQSRRQVCQIPARARTHAGADFIPFVNLNLGAASPSKYPPPSLGFVYPINNCNRGLIPRRRLRKNNTNLEE